MLGVPEPIKLVTLLDQPLQLPAYLFHEPVATAISTPELSALSAALPNVPPEASKVWFLSIVYTLTCILAFAATSLAFIQGVAVLQAECCQLVLVSFQLNDWSPFDKVSALKLASVFADTKLSSFQRTALVTSL